MGSPVIAPYSPGSGSPLAVFSPSTVSGSFPQMYEIYSPAPTLSMPEQLHTQHHPHPHQDQQYPHPQDQLQQHPYQDQQYPHPQDQLQQHPYQDHVHKTTQSHIPAHYSHHRLVRPSLSAQQLRSLQQLQIEQAMYERQFKIEQELQEQQRQAQQRSEQQRLEQQRLEQQCLEQQRLEQQRQDQQLLQQTQFLQHPLHIQLSSQSDKAKPSRRWSLTGRLFEKRKSAPEPTQSPSSSAPSLTRTTPSSLTGIICSHGRRSSLADLPKAFLSSLRRTSISGPGDGGTHASPSSKEPSVTSLPMGEPVGKAISIISMTEEDDDEEELSTATILTSTGLRQATFATPKAPPQTKSPPKSILKKRSMDTGTIGLPQPSPQVSKIEPNPDTSSNKTYPAMVAASDHHDLDSRSPPGPFSQPMTPSWTASAPMPPAGVSGAPIEAFELGIWPPVPKATTTPSPLLPSHLAKSDLSPPDLSPPSTPHRAVSHGAAFPPDFTPGVQSNSYQDCGGERPQGDVLGHLHESFPPQQFIYGGESVEHSQQQQQGATFRYQSSQISLDGPFALSEDLVLSDQEGLGHDYGQVESGRPISVGGYGPTNGMGSSGVLSGNGMNRRSINFLDTVEIIPAHRKSDYNRRSDKNATFRILTADMKSEIREELNSYKMREMAVHIESMGNTAFH